MERKVQYCVKCVILHPLNKITANLKKKCLLLLFLLKNADLLFALPLWQTLHNINRIINH